MMERHLDNELEQLAMNLMKMASLTEEAIHKAVEALKQQDKALARLVIDEDTKIDELEIENEEKAIDLLALKQPVAIDLRFLEAAIRVNADIERIADLAVNISQRVLELPEGPLLKPLEDIPKLSDVARVMVRKAIDSFINRDKSLAKEVILSDPEADRLRNSVQNELLNDYMVKDGKTAPKALPLLLIARHLERICDHATYIAEDVIYMVDAKMVKHHPEALDK